MIEEISNFLSKKDCETIIKMIDQNKTRSSVAGSGTSKSTYQETRTSSTSNLDLNNPTIKRVHKRIAKYLDLDITRGEALQGQLYEPGQYFKPHTDYFEGDTYINHCLGSGNRIHTLMIYLNSPEEGGETNFPNLEISYKPKRGKAISWPNMVDGQVIPDMLHEGSEVKKGKKYIITSWWRETTWDGNQDDQLGREHWENNKTQPLNNTLTFTTKNDLPRVTEKGFVVVKVPPTEWGIIQDCYNLLQPQKKIENWDGVKDWIKTDDESGLGSEIMSFDHLNTLRDLIHKSLQPLHETWSNQPLEPTSLYGIRSYNRGASLINHTDTVATHHISSIIIVDKDLSCGCSRKKLPEDWPLHIQSHDGKWHEIYANPGDMILYESAVCSHGRPTPFKGSFYRNFYVHYKFKDWTYQP